MPFSGWDNFYVIVGSSAAALTGLQFVVMALGAEGSNIRSQGVRAFATPTIVHFCNVLLASAILSAPWPVVSEAAVALLVQGLVGLGYTLLVIRHARRQRDYVPVFEDWLFHSVLPIAAYAALSLASLGLRLSPGLPLFVIAGTTLLLMLIGIHNAWDAAVWIAIERSKRLQDSGDRLGAISGDQSGANAAVVDANKKPAGQNNVRKHKHDRDRERRH